MSAYTMTADEVRELCERLGRTPETLARLFDRNAEMLTRLNATQGAAIERQNARACRAVTEGGAYGI